jgi:Ni/Co efflux regulator RcnB
MKRSLLMAAALTTFMVPALTPVASVAQDRQPATRDSDAARGGRDRARPPRQSNSENRPQRPERPTPPTERPSPSERPDRPQRPDRPARSEMPSRPDRPSRPEAPNRPERPYQPDADRPGRPDNNGGVNRPDRPDRPDRPTRPGQDRPDRPGRPDNNGGWNRPDRPDRPGQDRPNRPGRPDNNGGWNRPDRPNGGHWNRDRDRERREFRQRFNSDRWRTDWNRRHGSNWWRNDNRFRGYTGFRMGFYFAPGYGYYSVPRSYWGRHYQVGDYLPEIFWRYQLNDWRTYGLGFPPEGARWVMVDNYIYLIDDYDGYIIDVIRDAWSW